MSPVGRYGRTNLDSPPLAPRAARVLEYIRAYPGSSAYEIALGLADSDIDVRYITQTATGALAYRDLVRTEQSPGRGNSLGAYVNRYYPLEAPE